MVQGGDGTAPNSEQPTSKLKLRSPTTVRNHIARDFQLQQVRVCNRVKSPATVSLSRSIVDFLHIRWFGWMTLVVSVSKSDILLISYCKLTINEEERVLWIISIGSQAIATHYQSTYLVVPSVCLSVCLSRVFFKMLLFRQFSSE